MATFSSSCTWCAAMTTPMPPIPRTRSTRYLPASTSPGRRPLGSSWGLCMTPKSKLQRYTRVKRGPGTGRAAAGGLRGIERCTLLRAMRSQPSPPPAFFDALARDFPSDFCSRDPADLREYGRDWTRVVEPAPWPSRFRASTDEVARVVALCAEHRVAIVPSGGRTGLAGGRRRRARGARRCRSRKMRAMHPSTPSGARCACRRARSPRRCTSTARPHGLTWPVDFASKGSSTVGGNIATNAGGVKVIRYGLTRQWVLGLAGRPRERRGARAQRRAREEQHRARPAPALHRQRRDARRSSPRRR